MKPLETIFGSKLRAKILGWLFTHSDERYYVRQLTSILKEDPTNIGRELIRLTEAGLLKARTEGRQKYYQANSGSPVFVEFCGIAAKSIGIGDRLRNAVSGVQDRISVAFIFGSFAEGRANLNSDIDLMIIGAITPDAISQALSGPQRELGREINAAVYPASEFRDKLAKGNHFINALMSMKKIFLIGTEHELNRLAQ